MEAVDGGTRVTESYEVVRPVARIGWFVIERVFGCRNHRADLARGMEQTLRRLGDLITADAPAPRPASGPVERRTPRAAR